MSEMISKSVQRNYEHWTGAHKFFCRGRLMTGPRPYMPFLVLLLINSVSGVFIAFPLAFYTQEGNPALLILWLIMIILVNVFLVLTSTTDPGIIPPVTTHSVDVLKMNFVVQNSSFVKLKYWYTWNIVRPPRTVHWEPCGWCIERMDHHCPWLGGCVGKRNYLFFILFIITLALYCITGTIVTVFYCAELIVKKKEDLNTSSTKAFKAAMRTSPLTLPLIFVGLLFSVFIALLVVYHVKLLIQGRTTHEDLKETGYKIRPFDKLSIWKNISYILLNPWQQVKFKPRDIFTEPNIKYPLQKSRSENLSWVRHSVRTEIILNI